MEQKPRVPLTLEWLKNNIGNTIEWFAFGYSQNLPYAGKCKLLGFELDIRFKDGELKPIIEQISGDSLDYAWCEKQYYTCEYKPFTYTDSDRTVFIGKEFENYTLLWEVPEHGMLFGNDSAIQYSITHYIDGLYTLEQRIGKTTTADVVRVKETGDIYMKQSNGAYVPVVTIM